MISINEVELLWMQPFSEAPYETSIQPDFIQGFSL